MCGQRLTRNSDKPIVLVSLSFYFFCDICRYSEICNSSRQWSTGCGLTELVEPGGGPIVFSTAEVGELPSIGLDI